MTRLLSVVLIVLAGLPAAANATPTSLFVFGDSLADSGNNAAFFGTLRTPHPLMGPGAGPDFIPTFPYAVHDRYSNGRVWVEYLADGLGITDGAKAWLNGGTNFAFGGARTALDGTGLPLSLRSQVNTFLDAPGPAPSGALYVIQGGGNDARDTLEIAGQMLADFEDPTAFIGLRAAAYAASIASMVSDLEDAGAQKFLVANVPDIGVTPALRALGDGAQALATAIAGAMSAHLAFALAGLPDFDGRLWTLDMFHLVQDISQRPGAYGLSDVTSACAFSCSDPDRTLFWDGIHPTTAAHSLLAQQALLLIPAPGTIPLALLAGLVLLLALRRRPRAG